MSRLDAADGRTRIGRENGRVEAAFGVSLGIQQPRAEAPHLPGVGRADRVRIHLAHVHGLHPPVAVENADIPEADVAELFAVADHDALIASGVMVARDGDDRADVLRQLVNVLETAVVFAVSEAGTEIGNIADIDVGDKVNHIFSLNARQRDADVPAPVAVLGPDNLALCEFVGEFLAEGPGPDALRRGLRRGLGRRLGRRCDRRLGRRLGRRCDHRLGRRRLRGGYLSLRRSVQGGQGLAAGPQQGERRHERQQENGRQDAAGVCFFHSLL